MGNGTRLFPAGCGTGSIQLHPCCGIQMSGSYPSSVGGTSYPIDRTGLLGARPVVFICNPTVVEPPAVRD